MNNSVFGLKLVSKSVKLVHNPKDYVNTFSKHFVAIHEIKPVLTLNKPIYVGFSISDLSKYLTYDFHYKHIESRFDAKFVAY